MSGHAAMPFERHPHPWRMDQDWTLEVVDANGRTIESGFRSVEAAQTFIDSNGASKDPVTT